MKRLISFDFIRSISIIGIILCHCCYGISGMSFQGHFLGGTFNVVFLTLSAFLLGLAWERKQCKSYNIQFLKHRIIKLTYTYYPFLILMFILLAFTEYDVNMKDWLMHFLYLPWFDKLPGFGHLWFITLIVLCYITVYLFSKLPYYMLANIKIGGGNFSSCFSIYFRIY